MKNEFKKGTIFKVKNGEELVVTKVDDSHYVCVGENEDGKPYGIKICKSELKACNKEDAEEYTVVEANGEPIGRDEEYERQYHIVKVVNFFEEDTESFVFETEEEAKQFIELIDKSKNATLLYYGVGELSQKGIEKVKEVEEIKKHSERKVVENDDSDDIPGAVMQIIVDIIKGVQAKKDKKDIDELLEEIFGK